MTNRYAVVAHDGPRALAPGVVNTFSVNLLVQPGDVIGVNDQNAGAAPNACFFFAPGETSGAARAGDLPDGVSDDFATSPGFRTNVTADLLDKTPPETVIKKKKIRGTTAKFSFTSSEPGSAFQCKFDKHSFKPCKPPKKYKDLAQGRHKFKVQAIDKAGNVDATPAKKKFKI